jgi:hypothetical protein
MQLLLCAETDDARREKFSPWPLFMRDEVRTNVQSYIRSRLRMPPPKDNLMHALGPQLWRDMVSIRAKLKSKLPYYQKVGALNPNISRQPVW